MDLRARPNHSAYLTQSRHAPAFPGIPNRSAHQTMPNLATPNFSAGYLTLTPVQTSPRCTGPHPALAWPSLVQTQIDPSTSQTGRPLQCRAKQIQPQCPPIPTPDHLNSPEPQATTVRTHPYLTSAPADSTATNRSANLNPPIITIRQPSKLNRTYTRADQFPPKPKCKPFQTATELT